MKYINDFSKDMSKVFSLVSGECGGDSIQSALFGWFNGDIDVSADNEEDWVESYEYSDKGMVNVLYSVANYDLISLYGKKVNVENSNHPEIAEIFKKWAKPEAIKKVYEAIYE